ncbi:MAG TPA: type VI secretion system tip protein TssI/VgrG [Acetobacteraceae bacterium]|nr:type VI secretion system tip protein TssI/VgrG [Acetobacteraceae bacterium]
MSGSDSPHLLSLTTPLGAGVLQPISFQADEALSAPFAVEVEAVSDQSNIDPTGILYKQVSLSVYRTTGGTRIFNGMVRAFSAAGLPQRGKYLYRLSIVPKLWFMGQTSDCRIFQQQTVGDIIQTVCGEAGQTVQLKVFGTQSPQEYVTQYNETDLHFLTRLMEQAGLFYYFTHSSGDHVLVVTDQNQGFPSGAKPVLAVVHEGSNLDTLSYWQKRPHTAWGSTKLFDYDPANPTVAPEGTTPSTLGVAGAGTRDVVQWPALTTSAGTATDRTKFMMESAEASTALIDVAGSHHLMMPGAGFTLYRDPYTSASNVDHTVHSVRHRGTDESWIAGSGTGFYENSMVVFPAATTWRQAIATPRPVMAGVFAAIVIGESGEEIHADNLGRIKVRMMWDYRNDTVADKAVWARIIQPWAGNTWGWQHLPRVGSEVAVAFMDGDPDRPVVLGGLYNADQEPVFAIPGEETKSGWRTRSTKGGGTSNFSEFSVDDKMGSELMYVHAEKDMTTEVENDQKLAVTGNRTVTVEKDQTATITGNDTLTVKKDRKGTIQGNDTLEVQKQQTLTIDQGRTATVKQGGDALTVQMGDLTIKVSMGSVAIEAMQQIEMKVGGNSVKIDQTGVTVTGIMVKVEGQAMTTVKGAMTQVNGDGMLMLKGGIAMVN